jgi:hypothetical protein
MSVPFVAALLTVGVSKGCVFAHHYFSGIRIQKGHLKKVAFTGGVRRACSGSCEG